MNKRVLVKFSGEALAGAERLWYRYSNIRLYC